MKTIIWTDTLQTTFMLATVIIIAYTLTKNLGLDVTSVFNLIFESDYSKAFFLMIGGIINIFSNSFFRHVYGNCYDWTSSRSNAKKS